jgi:hypothetical protein
MGWTTFYGMLTAAIVFTTLRSQSIAMQKVALLVGFDYMASLFAMYGPFTDTAALIIAFADGAIGLFVLLGIAPHYHDKTARIVGTMFLPLACWQFYTFLRGIAGTWNDEAVENVVYVAQLLFVGAEAIRCGAFAGTDHHRYVDHHTLARGRHR